MLTSALFTMAVAAPSAGGSAELEGQVKKIFEDSCVSCHSGGTDPSDPAAYNLAVPPRDLLGTKSATNGKPMIVPGNPGQSYLLDKMYGTKGIDGLLMPLGGDALPAEQLKVVSDWIASLPAEDGSPPVPANGDREPPPRKKPKPFHGTNQIVLPTTATLGRRVLQYRIDHRFGRIGTERGAFGLDAGVVMSMGLAYGILDGWDVLLRRSNSRKGYELGTKYIGLRQEDKWPVSFGGYASVDFFRGFDVENPWTGNFMAMVSRLWFERWSTMLTVSYHLRTNHDPRPQVDFGDGPELVRDTRDTFVIGVASTVWLDKRKRWGIDFEWIVPIPDGADPNTFYYRGGDADPAGSKIGAWSIGGSLTTGLHFFQVFLTNNREIHLNLAAPGGQTGNPFDAPGESGINKANFFLGFNLARKFNIKKPKTSEERKKARDERKAKRARRKAGG